MSEPKHTPGPWLIFRPDVTGGWGWCVGTKDRLIARICGARNGTKDVSAEQKKADVRLIAAAPDLLLALTEMVAHFEAYDDWDDDVETQTCLYASRGIIRQALG